MAAAGSSRDVMLLFKGDNRSAVKALLGVADQSEKTTRTMKTDADQQTVALNRVKDSTERLRGAFAGLAGLVGIGGVAFGMKDLVMGGMALQTQQAQLQSALKATGLAAGDAQAKLQGYAESLSTQGGFTNIQNLQALTAFVSETHSATQAQQMLALATDIARRRNLDLSQTQTIVARAYTGSVGRLQQYLGPMVAAREAQVRLTQSHAAYVASLQNVAQFMGPLGQSMVRNALLQHYVTAQQTAAAQMTDKHTTAMQTLALAEKYFAGSTEAYSRTTQGKITILRNTFQNLIDNLGKALLPTVNTVVGVFAKLAHFLAQNKGLVAALIGPVIALGAAWGTLKVLQTIKNMALELGAALRLTGEEGLLGGRLAAEGALTAGIAWKAFMTTTIIGLVLVGLMELVQHWKQVQAAVTAVWQGIETAAAAAWGWIKGHWPLLLGILLAPFTGGISIIVGLFHNQLIGAVVDVWHTIERVATNIFNALTWPFRKAWGFIKGVFHDISGAVGGIVHTAGSILNTVSFGLFNSGGMVPKHLAVGGGPFGSDTVPAWLTPQEAVLNTRAVSLIGGPQGVNALNQGLGGGLPGGNTTITPSQAVFQLDGRVVGRAVVRWALNEAARGPTTLVGGSLVTGGPGLPASGLAL